MAGHAGPRWRCDNIAAHIVQRVGHPEWAFASADHTLRETFRVMRGGSHSMEGRAVVARYDEALDAFTVWDATQAPHAIRTMLAYLFDLPEHRVRVIAPPDVGGGLGPKASFYPEEALVCWLARRLRRPVKWIEDRHEHFISAAQERQQIHTIEIAFTRDGVLLALRDVFTHDIGMYGALVAPVITACTVPGPYRIPSNALYEEAFYDEQGQCLASSFLDYPLPSAREMPRVEMFHLTTPSPINPLGVTGAGEAGTLPVPAAVAGAVEDALRPLGVRVTRMPLSPARISDLVHGT
jgi:CO/xanthine dehydrogenase Mo-binding subunit